MPYLPGYSRIEGENGPYQDRLIEAGRYNWMVPVLVCADWDTDSLNRHIEALRAWLESE